MDRANHGLTRSLVRTAIGTAVATLLIGGLGAGCLSRPVSTQQPTTKDNFATTLRQSAIDKVDLLFDIDNSASMGDKQAYLSAAVPDLLTRLLSPYCVDDNGANINDATGKPLTSDVNGVCTQGTAEFKPVHDMHIGVITTSLGTRGGDLCDPSTGADNDTKGELVNRGAAGPNPDTAPSNFLTWFPSTSTANQGKTAPAGFTAISDPAKLESDFADVISGVAQNGCGIESQLETWYRFLVQPDPYNDIKIDGSKNPPTASWDGVDGNIIKQRHDFLRPDSLVAIIVLTDENDSEVDARSVSGTGFNFMSSKFDPPRGTSPCDTNPADPNCTSCGFGTAPSDPNCTKGSKPGQYSDANDWGYDPNLRHVHTQAKYGVDPQFPITRYVKGLTQTKIPDRNGEYPTDKSGAVSGKYVGNPDCTNPLYAATLPDGSDLSPQGLCNLTVGFQRTSDLVFFGIIGGVPNELLHFDPTDPTSLTLSAADWTKILGNDPQNYDYTGIDPHMIESYQPRTAGAPGVPANIAAPLTGETAIQAATAANNADPWNGREWVTDTAGVQTTNNMPFAVDREYACIFKLATARDCTQAANRNACDCPTDGTKAPTADKIPPVCDSSNVTSQIAAKVYPTPRELLLAKLMGDQGIAASLCPIDVTDNATGSDPLYGYRPAVAAIVERLKNALAAQCLPQPLTPQPPDGTVPCLVLEALQPGSTCDPAKGLSTPTPAIANNYRAQLTAESGGADSGTDASQFVICQLGQILNADLINGSCTDNAEKDAGWCYVTGKAAGGSCGQAIKFSQSGNPSGGARVSLQCINQSSGTTSSGDGG